MNVFGRAWRHLRTSVKFIIMDVESGDYEIDEQGIESSHRLQARHAGEVLYALRIGYKTAVSFCGGLVRSREGGQVTVQRSN